MAREDGVALRIVLGPALAAVLAGDRQDLRQRYLGIPIGAHTRASVLSDLELRLKESLPTPVRDALARRTIARPTSDRSLHSLLGSEKIASYLSPRQLASASLSGQPGTCSRGRRSGPWCRAPANRLKLAQADSIALRVAQMAYGAAHAERIAELAALMKRERMRLLVVLDSNRGGARLPGPPRRGRRLSWRCSWSACACSSNVPRGGGPLLL